MGLTMNSTTDFASRRRSATARIARPISRCSFNLTDTAAFEKTIEACVEWMVPKAGGNLPVEALRGQPFDLVGQYQANPYRAVRLDVPDGSVWAAWLSEFSDGSADGTPPRNWITELFVERRAGEMVRFGTQLSFLGRSDDRDFILTRPRLVQNILELLSAEADGQPIQEVPAQIGEADVDEFEALVYSQGRRLPIIALSQNTDGNYLVNPLQVARRLVVRTRRRACSAGSSSCAPWSEQRADRRKAAMTWPRRTREACCVASPATSIWGGRAAVTSCDVARRRVG